MKTRYLMLAVILALVLQLFAMRARPQRQAAMSEPDTSAAATEQLRPQYKGHDRVWTVRPDTFWSAMALPQMKSHTAAWVDERIAKWRVRGGDTAFDRLGFAPSLQQALKMAREQNRLLFLLVDRGNVFKCRA